MTDTPKPQRPKARIREEIFAREYVIDLNGTRAAIAAGYSQKTAEVTASKLLRKAKVQELIQTLVSRRAEKLEITGERVVRELALIGFANMLDYVKPQADGSALVDLSKLTREQAAAMQEITVDQYTEGRGDDARDVKRVRFKLGDKPKSLELLGKHLRIFTDRVEHSFDENGFFIRTASPERCREALRQIEQLRGRDANGKTNEAIDTSSR